ncbi:MFS transporter [Microlunatus sp. GCM10028923]|uniref:MFS transporter n=1 Tax=Microlunatus sp. GCM10028923 TaxID=3273400 RepID=UPI00360ECD32
MNSHVSLARRLLPLHVSVFLAGFGLWVPIEKLFLGELGFQPFTIGVMAATYAAVVPVVEIPSGILADRWSRRGVMIIGTAALMISVLLGGLSTDVTGYLVCVAVLGVYFALTSGTVDAMVYDTVVEHTGSGAAFARRIGRIRLIESVALVGSGLAGGWLASVTTARLTYLITVPIVALSIIALLRFREPPRLSGERREPLRAQVSATFSTMIGSAAVRRAAALSVLSAVLLNTLYEFGPLWLVALSAATVIFGPAWAGLMATIGIGGLVADRVRLERPVPYLITAGVALLATLTMIIGREVLLVTVAQIALALVIMVISLRATTLLHDAVPSEVRAGVASGVSSLSWLAFLPFSLLFGLINQAAGVFAAGWLVAGVVVAALIVVSRCVLVHRTDRESCNAPVAAARQ